MKYIFFTLSILLLFSNTVVSKTLHPPITPRESFGRISIEKSCQDCHDAHKINLNNSHFNSTFQVNCLHCHGQPDLSLDQQLITSPKNAHCLKCHGGIKENRHNLPTELLELNTNDIKVYLLPNLALKTGALLSGDRIDHSFLNLEHKSLSNIPFDIHLARKLKCIDCHFSEDNPLRNTYESDLAYLKFDTRKIPDLSKFLTNPGHKLKGPSCINCHNTKVGHTFLPNKQRHFKKLACTSCHIPYLSGPTLQIIDQAIITNHSPNGFLQFHNLKNIQSPINSSLITKLKPVLLSGEFSEDKLIHPYNPMLVRQWISKKFPEGIRKEDIFKITKKLKLTIKEINYFNETKFANELIKIGYISPSLESRVNFQKVSHGIRKLNKEILDCNYCHQQNNPLTTSIVFPTQISINSPPKNKSIEIEYNNDSIILRRKRTDGHYIFGHSRFELINQFGFWTFVLTLIGIFIHGFFRYQTRVPVQDNIINKSQVKKILMYSTYERLWHWTLAFSVIVLLITGFEIHLGGSLTFLGMRLSVSIHNIFAFILIINSGLSFFYHLASQEIQQYLPTESGFSKIVIKQLKYYLHGIFKHLPHPTHKSKGHKLNPLQKITYLLLLNILLPVQILSGLVILYYDFFNSYINLNGMSLFAAIHHVSAWSFMVFLIVHVYLTTTGDKITTNLKAMATGFEDTIQENNDE